MNDPGPFKPLTSKQLQVLRCLEDLQDYEEIGLSVKVSPGRARNIVREIADTLPNPHKRPAYRLAALYAIAERFRRLHPAAAAEVERGAEPDRTLTD